jgi:15,16-dihydrobiliverdin:ferredoxin oxidoreductase
MMRAAIRLVLCMSVAAAVDAFSVGNVFYRPLSRDSGNFLIFLTSNLQAMSFLREPLPGMHRPHFGHALSSRKGSLMAGKYAVVAAKCAGSRLGLRAACKVKAALALSDERTKTIPWSESIVPGNRLLYMPFLEYQLKFMRENVEGLKELPFEEHFSLQKSSRKPGIIESWQYESKDFRKIRLTYIDCGIGAQVFNSVWYPRYSMDAPIFGIDFLAFGPKKVLAILDLQPLTQDPKYLEKYIDPLIPLRNKYQDLCGRMSGKFYDEVQFFSRQLLFGRFDNDGPVMESLYPAFKEYLDYYTEMIKGLDKDESSANVAYVEGLHRAYDQYSAEKDPAVGLFKTYWGEEWAEDFTYNFLFSFAVPPAPEAVARAPGSYSDKTGYYKDAKVQGKTFLLLLCV